MANFIAGENALQMRGPSKSDGTADIAFMITETQNPNTILK